MNPRVVTLALALAFVPPAARADVEGVVENLILPGHDAFAAAAADLSETAATTCDPDRLRPAYHDAFDAWMGVSHVSFGPVEAGGRGLAIAFWPDPKASGARAQQALLAGNPGALTPEAMAEQSVAARGLFALERLLYPADEAWTSPAACALTRASAIDLARTAAEIAKDWRAEAGPALLTAGDPGNADYLSPDEATQALLTALVAGLEFTADQRLGRPLGTFDAPHPERAEALASGRPLRNVALSLAALDDLARALVPDAPLTRAAFARARGLADALDDPVLAGVAGPQGRLRVEILQQAVHAARDAVLAEMVPALGVGLGFNAADGD